MGVAAGLTGDVTDVVVVGGIYREQVSTPHPHSRIGGSGLYAAVAAASLGSSTALAGAVGADDAEELHAILRKAGVDGSAVAIMPGSSAAFVFQDEGEVEAPIVQFKHAHSSPVLSHDPPAARVVLVFGMPDLDPFESGLVARWVEAQSTLIWDRQGWLSKTQDAVAASGVVARSKIYVANFGEAAQEAGGATPQQLLQSHPLPGFAYALLKNGRWGTTLLSSNRERTPIPAFRVSAASTIGSGDVFAGALAAGLARSEEIRTASITASAASAVAIAQASPLLFRSARRRVEVMAAAGNGSYVDPVLLSSVVVAVDGEVAAALKSLAAELQARLRNLGILVEGIGSSAASISVALRFGERGVVADVCGAGKSEAVELGAAPDLRLLVNVIADCIGAAP